MQIIELQSDVRPSSLTLQAREEAAAKEKAAKAQEDELAKLKQQLVPLEQQLAELRKVRLPPIRWIVEFGLLRCLSIRCTRVAALLVRFAPKWSVAGQPRTCPGWPHECDLLQAVRGNEQRASELEAQAKKATDDADVAQVRDPQGCGTQAYWHR